MRYADVWYRYDLLAEIANPATFSCFEFFEADDAPAEAIAIFSDRLLYLLDYCDIAPV